MTNIVNIFTITQEKIEKILTIKEKILEVAKQKGFTIEDFCKNINMSYGNFKGSAKKRPINSTAIENILSIIPDLNLNWLFKNQGEMFISNTIDDNTQNNDTLYKELLEEQKQELREAYKEIGKLQARLEESNQNTNTTEDYKKGRNAS